MSLLMSSKNKHLIYRSIHWFLRWIEASYTINPSDLGSRHWQDQAASSQCASLTYPEKHQPSPSEPDWCWNDLVARPGVCTLYKVRVWMLFIHTGSISVESDRRRAIVFDHRYRRLSILGSPVVLPRCLLHGEWRQWWSDRRQRVHLAGRVAMLGDRVSDCRNYYHFWVDTIADIWYLRQLLPASEMPQRYLMAYCDLSWQRQILDLCGIHPDQVIPFSRYPWLSVEELIVPVRDKGAAALPPWQAAAIRSMAGWKGSREPAARRLFLSRADAPRRKVVNEDQIHGRLRAQGFEVLTLDGLSVPEQQRLFASAAVIFAPHGAALTNLVWCRPGTVVVDFLSEKHLAPCFRELAWQSEVTYYPVVCQVVENESMGIDAHIEITYEQIDTALKWIAPVTPVYSSQ